MSPKIDVSEERKAQILDAAKVTFAERGFSKTRMSDIAEESGLSKGALYLYFESKDAIILNLLERVFEPEIRDLRSLLVNDRSAEERLLIYANRAAEDIQKMLGWMALVYEFIVLAFRRDPIKKFISSFYKRNMDLVEELIQQGIDSGEFQASSAKEAAIAVGGIIEGTILLWLVDPEGINIQGSTSRDISNPASNFCSRGCAPLRSKVQMEIPPPPRGLRAIPWKLPIFIYRVGLGWILGNRFLLLRHRGRKTGKIRTAVLEVIHSKPEKGVYLVVSGFGNRSDWYLNILQHNKVEIQISNKRWPATAHQLEADHAAQVILAYAQKYPGNLETLSKLVGYEIEFTPQGILEFGHQIPVIQFTTDEHSTKNEIPSPTT
jgi:deazaflavin-dependent oxidoreductase (nitroreductase family)